MLIRILCCAITVTLATGFPGYAQNAKTQVWPGWARQTPAPTVEADDYLRCIGDDCAGNTLACTLFHVPGDTDDERAITPDQFPWRQFESWTANQLTAERQDILGTPPVINDSKRLAGPTLHRMNGRLLVSAVYAARTRDSDIGFSVALWVEGHAIHGLRCSYRLTGNNEAVERITALLALRLSAPAAH